MMVFRALSLSRDGGAAGGGTGEACRGADGDRGETPAQSQETRHITSFPPVEQRFTYI